MNIQVYADVEGASNGFGLVRLVDVVVVGCDVYDVDVDVDVDVVVVVVVVVMTASGSWSGR